MKVPLLTVKPDILVWSATQKGNLQTCNPISLNGRIVNQRSLKSHNQSSVSVLTGCSQIQCIKGAASLENPDKKQKLRIKKSRKNAMSIMVV